MFSIAEWRRERRSRESMPPNVFSIAAAIAAGTSPGTSALEKREGTGQMEAKGQDNDRRQEHNLPLVRQGCRGGGALLRLAVSQQRGEGRASGPGGLSGRQEGRRADG